MNPPLSAKTAQATEHDATSTGEHSEARVRSAAPVDAPETGAPQQVPPKPRRPRGFAAMDRKKVSEIASKGGKAAHAAGTAHQFTSDEARTAGHKGGVAPHVRRGRGPRQEPAAQGEPENDGST